MQHHTIDIKNSFPNSPKEWMNMKEAAAYIGVSFNTLTKFRTLGLKICEIDGVKRVSRKQIDQFLQEYSN